MFVTIIMGIIFIGMIIFWVKVSSDEEKEDAGCILAAFIFLVVGVLFFMLIEIGISTIVDAFYDWL